MAFLTKLLLLLCATIPLGLANPVPNPVAIPDPNPIVPIQPACTTSIHIDNTAKGWPGAAQTLPGHCTPGPAGCSLSISESYSYGVTWGVGASLGITIQEIFDVGISPGVYYTTTATVGETLTVNCPTGGAHFVCGMGFSPSMIYITGHITVNSTGEVTGEVCNPPTNTEYAVEVPQTSGGKTPLPVVSSWPCSCAGQSTLPACPQNCGSPS
ncbi:hypothetical protein JMJ35_000965 [Cladonia borealis]|uniref:Uncharacterized protein n=1 Tax=Cladonia borealis TaxID=184061 RepID=A0AA39R7K4_9LECA|nr:hypothetical protein JMJ35_000965 [Cladonia borealis]